MGERPQHEVPYLHVRAPRRIVGVGGEADRPDAKIVGNRAGLLKLREHIDRAPALEEGLARIDGPYFEVDERGQMGEPREPDRPDYSMFA